MTSEKPIVCRKSCVLSSSFPALPHDPGVRSESSQDLLFDSIVLLYLGPELDLSIPRDNNSSFEDDSLSDSEENARGPKRMQLFKLPESEKVWRHIKR